MGVPSLLNSEDEVLCYAQTVEGERRACCGALDSEQCGAARSFHDTLNCVDPSHEFLHGSEPLRCTTGIWNGQGDRYTRADKRAGAYRSHQPQAGPPQSEGISEASDSSDRGIGSPQNPSTKPGPLAPVQENEAATTLSGGSSYGSAKEGNTMGTAEASAGEPPQRRRGKRKLPVPDLDAIEDPVELRLQRRLLKNRRTAAASRERKQKEMDSLVAHVRALEADNEKLRQALHQRNAQIRTLHTNAAPQREFALAALAPLPRSAGPVFRGNLPLHGGFHASPALPQQP
ncbi:hypothetical protein COCOBI_19-1380 [Coccomyxa sp. Obi]|nr:hypothetical protein COCOBI_19-1380 [Coccomyxa sp. Obi]